MADREATFGLVAERARLCKARLYVETGCFRGNVEGDGQSTQRFAKLARETGGMLVSIDVSIDNICCARSALPEELRPFVVFVCADSCAALAMLAGPIDVLYLDSLDYVESDSEPSQFHQLAEARMAFPLLSSASTVLLDDCGLPGGGKARFSHEFLVEQGCRLVADAYQRVYEY